MTLRTLVSIPLFSLLLVFAPACDPEVADVATETPDDLPDVTGSYTVAITDRSGCDGLPGDLTWMEGALQITGEPTALELEFAGGDVLIGVVESLSALYLASGLKEPVVFALFLLLLLFRHAGLLGRART